MGRSTREVPRTGNQEEARGQNSESGQSRRGTKRGRTGSSGGEKRRKVEGKEKGNLKLCYSPDRGGKKETLNCAIALIEGGKRKP